MNDDRDSDRLAAMGKRYEEIQALLSDPAVFTNSQLLTKYGREQAELAPVAHAFEGLRKLEDDIALYTEMTEDGLNEGELEEARGELRRLRAPRPRRWKRRDSCCCRRIPTMSGT